jgi:DNA repair exonuclease SbcCD ATPase subunit
MLKLTKTAGTPRASAKRVALVNPSNVQELVRAWKVSGRKAQVLESRLVQAVEVARRYRRDLLRLAEQNRSHKLQADSLQQRLLTLLEERQSPPSATSPEALVVPEGDESVPAEFVRQLLQRLREAHELAQEFERLLEFRERQVHELIACQAQGPSHEDWRVATLQRELTDARHRIRMLTQELAQQSAPAGDAAERISQLEQKVIELASQDSSQLQLQLEEKSQLIHQLEAVVHSRTEELKKAAATIGAARDKIRALESQSGDANELLEEVTRLQDEIARLEGESEVIPELRSQIQELKKNGAGPAPNQERMARLEAAVVDLREKLQLAGSKYQQVAQALREKHQALVELQGRSSESQKKEQFLEPLVRTLEAALEESRRQNATLQAQMEALRKAGAAPTAEPSEALASMESKLKEARRSAVRAQAEAGLKRKELAKANEELEAMKAKVIALGGTP